MLKDDLRVAGQHDSVGCILQPRHIHQEVQFLLVDKIGDNAPGTLTTGIHRGDRLAHFAFLFPRRRP